MYCPKFFKTIFRLAIPASFRFTDYNILTACQSENGQIERELFRNSCGFRFNVSFVDWTSVFVMYRSNRSFNMPPPGNPPGHLTFLKIIVQIPHYPGQNAVQMPHTRVHSGDQMPRPGGHFTGTKMIEGRRKYLQLSSKIFINVTRNT